MRGIGVIVKGMGAKGKGRSVSEDQMKSTDKLVGDKAVIRDVPRPTEQVGGNLSDTESFSEEKYYHENPSTYVLVLTCFAAIGGLLFGYDTGVISGALVEIGDHFDDVTDMWKEMIVSGTVFGAIVGALIGGPLNNIWGRKPVIISASVIFIVGAIVMGVAQTLEELLIGRIVVGLGIGMVSMTVPVYLAETAPDRMRGRLVVVNSLFLTGGQAIANVICGILQDYHDGWRWMLGLSGIPALVQLIGFLYLPESPRFLLSKGKEEESKKVLQTIRAREDVEGEFERLAESIAFEKANTAPFMDVFKRGARQALLIGCMLQAIQQLGGINTVMYYAATIFQMAGMSNNMSIWLSAVTAGVNFIFTGVAFLLIDRLGRKPLLLISAMGICIMLNILAVSFYLGQIHSDDVVSNPIIYQNSTHAEACNAYSNAYDCTQNGNCGFCVTNNYCLPGDDDGPTEGYSCEGGGNWNFKFSPNPYWWLSLVSLVLYICFFAPGLGTMPWVVQSEIFPLRVRGHGSSLATATNWGVNAIVSFTFLTLVNALTPAGAFWLYSGVALLSFLFILFVVPETKGKTIEVISEMFHG
eukprot:Nk52_evm55s236 gene=Nk52_evmTU55s236